MITEATVALVRELRGVTCRCGAPKVARQTFCKTCYAWLPRDLQQALYRLVGNGYEEAYERGARIIDYIVAVDKAKIARLKNS